LTPGTLESLNPYIINMPYCTQKDGTRLYYESSGKGNSILFIHGWSFDSKIWEIQKKILNDHFHIITVDLRGHGKSEAGKMRLSLQQFAFDLVHLLEKLDLHEVNVAGWSMGGCLALRLSLSCPERMKSLILISTTPSLIQREGFPHALPLSTVKRLRTQVLRDHRKAIQTFRNLILSPEEERLDTIDAIKNSLRHDLNIPRDVTEISLVSLMEEDLRNSLNGISLPTLIIHGEKDRLCLPQAALFLREKLVHAKLLMLKESGHAPFLTYPLHFFRGLTEFLHSL